MISKTKKGLTALEMMVTGGILGLVALIVSGTIFNNIQNDTALISYEGSMKKVRTALYVCGLDKSPVPFAASEGVEICGGEEKFPVLSERCNNRTLSYQIKRTDRSWELTTVQASDSDQLWYCRGCNIQCTSNGCTYNELEKGACLQDR